MSREFRDSPPAVLPEGFEWARVGERFRPGWMFFNNTEFVPSQFDQSESRLPHEGVVHFPFHYIKPISKEDAQCELTALCQI